MKIIKFLYTSLAILIFSLVLIYSCNTSTINSVTKSSDSLNKNTDNTTSRNDSELLIAINLDSTSLVFDTTNKKMNFKVYEKNKVLFFYYKDETRIVFDSISYTIDKNNSHEKCHGIATLIGNTIEYNQFLNFNDSIFYFTIYDESYRVVLFSLTINKNKKSFTFIKDISFQRQYLYSYLGYFLVDASKNKILAVDKAVFEESKEVYLPIYVYQIFNNNYILKKEYKQFGERINFNSDDEANLYARELAYKYLK